MTARDPPLRTDEAAMASGRAAPLSPDDARLALEISEVRYRRLFETARDGILLLNAATGRIDDANPYLLNLLGYSAAELVGRKLWEIGAWADEEQSHRMFATVQLDGYVRYDDLPLKTKAGTSIAVEFVSNSYDVAGVIVIQCNIRDITVRRQVEEERRLLAQKLNASLMSLVEVICRLSAMRDPYTVGHEHRVSDLAVGIGQDLGFDAARLQGLGIAARLHDVGKLVVPSEFLSKPGPLTSLERSLVQEHAQAGYDVLRTVEWPWPVPEVALQHHERIDGSGYPQGLRDADILLESKIVAVADVFEAMVSLRPYRAPLAMAQALEEIRRGRGVTYDASAADACLRLFTEGGFRLAG